MDKDEKKIFTDLFSKGISEQNIEARHCETLSISLLTFSITSVLAILTALLNLRGLHWQTFELMQPVICVYGVAFMLLGFMLMTSRKQAIVQAKKSINFYYQYKTASFRVLSGAFRYKHPCRGRPFWISFKSTDDGVLFWFYIICYRANIFSCRID